MGWAIGVAAGVAALVGGCDGPQGTPAAPPARDNLVLVTCDTLRADHLKSYGYFRDPAPHLDEFARGCVLFERCLSPIAHTTPSHLSMLTGVYPIEHGVVANSLQINGEEGCAPFAPSAQLESFAQLAHAQGWATGGFVSAAPLKRVTGVSVGFDEWSEPDGARRAGTETNAAAFAWLERVKGGPFFLWVHYYEPHGPYVAGEHPPASHAKLFTADEALARHLAERRFPEKVAGVKVGEVAPRDVVDLYDGCIRLLDDRLADLFSELETLGVAGRTTVVLTGDHGQGLGQHGDLAHGLVWREQLAVPFLIKAHGLAPARVDALVSTLDVLATAAAHTRGFDAKGFLAQARGRDVLVAGFESRPLFAMVPVFKRRAPGLALTTEKWQLVRDDQGDHLYSLEADPYELEDVAAERPEVARSLARELDAQWKEQRARRKQLRGETSGVDAAADAKRRAELEALGYVDDDDEPAPKGDDHR
ncbi:MAG TPA: sulfatase-like hydrolase/transferase [Planctomycetota bacterium]|jgi:arylsulfatase|nr:sulfatase-like hydrolase/transferase [Planctomycetota bacterium]